MQQMLIFFMFFCNGLLQATLLQNCNSHSKAISYWVVDVIAQEVLCWLGSWLKWNLWPALIQWALPPLISQLDWIFTQRWLRWWYTVVTVEWSFLRVLEICFQTPPACGPLANLGLEKWLIKEYYFFPFNSPQYTLVKNKLNEPR